MSHTPGPWTIACESGEWFATLIDHAPIPATEANARLIAAAPELLAPARELLALYDWRPELAKLEATLKNDGTDARNTVGHIRRMLREYGERKKAGWIALRAAISKAEGK